MLIKKVSICGDLTNLRKSWFFVCLIITILCPIDQFKTNELIIVNTLDENNWLKKDLAKNNPDEEIIL